MVSRTHMQGKYMCEEDVNYISGVFFGSLCNQELSVLALLVLLALSVTSPPMHVLG